MSLVPRELRGKSWSYCRALDLELEDLSAVRLCMCSDRRTVSNRTIAAAERQSASVNLPIPAVAPMAASGNSNRW